MSFASRRSGSWFNIVRVLDRLPPVRFVEQDDVTSCSPNVDSKCSKSGVGMDNLHGLEKLHHVHVDAEFLPDRGNIDQGTLQASTRRGWVCLVRALYAQPRRKESSLPATFDLH